MKDVTLENWQHQTPANTILYAIGDLHGHLSAHELLYQELETEIAKKPEKQHVIIYLGDYIDRGPQSAQLIERLRNLSNRGNLKHIFIMGNHEFGFLGYMEDPEQYAIWLKYGGVETAQSYNCHVESHQLLPDEHKKLQQELNENVPPSHKNFINNLEKIVVIGDYAFTHAGIRPGIPLEQQKEEDLRFIREPFLSSDEPHEKCIVHGHTIAKEAEIKFNRINLDTGFYQSHILSCGVFENNTVKLLQINNQPQ